MNTKAKSALKFAVLAGGRENGSAVETPRQEAVSHLKVVPVHNDLHSGLSLPHRLLPHSQLRLPLIDPASLVVVNMNDLRYSYDFLQLFRYVKPRAVFDVRIRPEFYIDVNLNHKGVFRLFDEISAEYFDITTGLLGIDDQEHPGLQPESLGAAISIKLALLSEPSFPLVVLAAREQTARALLKSLPQYLLPQPRGGWNAVLHRDLLDLVQGISSGAKIRGR